MRFVPHLAKITIDYLDTAYCKRYY